MNEDMEGRLDLLLLRCGELIGQKVQAATGVDIWTPELESSVRELIKDAGVPSERIDFGTTVGDEIARAIRPPPPRRVRGKRRASHVR